MSEEGSKYNGMGSLERKKANFKFERRINQSNKSIKKKITSKMSLHPLYLLPSSLIFFYMDTNTHTLVIFICVDLLLSYIYVFVFFFPQIHLLVLSLAIGQYIIDTFFPVTTPPPSAW